jgi:hypothetical protein
MTTLLTHAELLQFTGDLERFRHPLARGVIYTPGVRFLAERAGAYWLIDEMAFAIAGGEMAKAGRCDPRVLDLHFWRLEVREDRSADLTARADSGVEPFLTRRIPWTDFPLDHIEVWAGFDGRYWTLYLPSEH